MLTKGEFKLEVDKSFVCGGVRYMIEPDYSNANRMILSSDFGDGRRRHVTGLFRTGNYWSGDADGKYWRFWFMDKQVMVGKSLATASEPHIVIREGKLVRNSKKLSYHHR